MSDHPRQSRNVRSIIFLLLFATITGCATDVKKFRRSYGEKLHYGMTRPELEDALRDPGRQQFMIYEDNAVITAVQYTFVDRESINFVFCNNQLVNIIHAVYGRRASSVSDDRKASVMIMYNRPQVSIERFVKYMLEKQRLHDASVRAEYVMWSPVVVVTAPLLPIGLSVAGAESARDASRRSGYRKAFDPALAQPLMTRQDLLDQFGEPPFTRISDDSESWIYGPLQSLERDSPDDIRFIKKDDRFRRYWYELIFEDGIVTQIYSDTFFKAKGRLSLQNQLSPEAKAYFNRIDP